MELSLTEEFVQEDSDKYGAPIQRGSVTHVLNTYPLQTKQTCAGTYPTAHNAGAVQNCWCFDHVQIPNDMRQVEEIRKTALRETSQMGNQNPS